MTNILLDNIVFSCQKAGGISVVWKEHIERLLCDQRFRTQFIEYAGCENNVFRRELSIPASAIIRKKSFAINYWKNLDLWNKGNDSYIFHSSTYRIDHNRHALNVTTVHDFAYEYFVSGMRKWVNGFSKFHAIRNSDAIICVSESTKLDLLKFVKGVDENKLFVVHNGVNECYCQITSDQYTMKLPFSDQEFVLYVGNRRDYKNFAAALYCCKKIKAPLVVAGGEIFTEKEQAEMNAILGEGHYYVTGKVTNEQLNELYNRAQLMLYPSRFEGFGIPVLEAQRAGCPVVCLALTSIPEVMGDSPLCLNDSSNDAIADAVKMVFDNSELRKKEIVRGLKNSMRFGWDKTYKGVTDIYMNLLNR